MPKGGVEDVVTGKQAGGRWQSDSIKSAHFAKMVSVFGFLDKISRGLSWMTDRAVHG